MYIENSINDLNTSNNHIQKKIHFGPFKLHANLSTHLTFNLGFLIGF